MLSLYTSLPPDGVDAKAVRALTYAQAHALRSNHESVTCGVVGGKTTADHLKWTCPNGIMVEHYKVGSLALELRFGDTKMNCVKLWCFRARFCNSALMHRQIIDGGHNVGYSVQVNPQTHVSMCPFLFVDGIMAQESVSVQDLKCRLARCAHASKLLK